MTSPYSHITIQLYAHPPVTFTLNQYTTALDHCARAALDDDAIKGFDSRPKLKSFLNMFGK